MKKVVSFVLIFIILISSIVVYADDEELEEVNTDNSKYEVNLKSSSANLKQGDEVTLSIMLENINIDEGKGGVAGVEGTLSYDENVFEIDKFEGSNWELMANGKTFLANSKDGNTTTNALEIGKVTLKVKDDASDGTTVVNISGITGSVGELALRDMDGQSKDLTLFISNTENDEPEHEETVSIVGIIITAKPDKTAYVVGDKFNKAGMVIVVEYSNGDVEEITDYTYAPTGSLTLDNKEITITYKKDDVIKTVTQPIEVVKSSQEITAKLSKIEIKSKPIKAEYTEGEKFDKTGMVVVAKYSDGTSKEVTNYTVSPSENLKEDDKQVKITFSEDGVTVEQTFDIKVNKASISDATTEIYSTNLKQDTTVAVKKLPQTGTIGIIIPMIIAVLIGGAIISLKKYRKMM